MEHLITAKDIFKIFKRGSEEIRAINGISLDIDAGDIVAITGESGSGKTTFVNIIGSLDNPTSGELCINGRCVFAPGAALTEGELTRIRREIFGYVFQKFFLVPTLTVAENIVLPGVFQPKLEVSDAELDKLMDMLGILARKNHLPWHLSGGEMQRVAIARALALRSKVLIADEPTGNLDSKRSEEIKELLVRLNREQGITIILVTHNHNLAKIGKRVYVMKDGRFIE
ncbi:MAG: ABC transporter ATP-binding protein [Spirochaetota bacterium]|nr:ABC transporter ATP-binding protein [Spirochaetota bacterium]